MEREESGTWTKLLEEREPFTPVAPVTQADDSISTLDPDDSLDSPYLSLSTSGEIAQRLVPLTDEDKRTAVDVPVPFPSSV